MIGRQIRQSGRYVSTGEYPSALIVSEQPDSRFSGDRYCVQLEVYPDNGDKDYRVAGDYDLTLDEAHRMFRSRLDGHKNERHVIIS